MFQPMVEKLLHIEQFFEWKFIEIKTKITREFGHVFDIIGKPWWVGFNEGDLEIVRSQVQDILNFE
jgi:hypothetical protein